MATIWAAVSEASTHVVDPGPPVDDISFLLAECTVLIGEADDRADMHAELVGCRWNSRGRQAEEFPWEF